MAGPHDTETLLVLPVFDRVEDELRSRARRAGWADPRGVVTFSALVDGIAEAALARAPAEAAGTDAWWCGRRFASTAELTVLRRRLLAECDAPLAEMVGSARLGELFGRFAEECAEGAVEPAEMRAFVAQHDPDSPRLALLSDLLARYRQALDERGWLDASDRLRLAHDALAPPHALPPMLSRVRRVEVRGQYDWSARRLGLLVRLALRLGEILGPPERVRLVVPYSHAGQHLFHYMEASLRELEARAEAPIDVVFEALEGADGGGPGFVAAQLFADGGPSDVGRRKAGALEPDQVVSLRATPTRSQELRAAGREIRRLVDEGTAPDRIAIALRRPERSWQDVARALEAHGLPWHYRRGSVLADTPLLAYVSDLLTAVVEGLPRIALERVLTSAFTPASTPSESGTGRDELAAEALDLDDRERRAPRAVDSRMVALLRAAGVRDLGTGAELGADSDGRPTIVRNGYAVRLEAYLRRLQPPAAPESPRRRARWKARWRAYDRQATQARAILERIDLLSTLTAPRSLAAWAAALAELFSHPAFDPQESLARPPLDSPSVDSPPRLDRATAEAQALDQQSWAALQQVLADLSRAEGAGELVLSTAGFRSVLLEVARQSSLNPVGGRGAAVRIVPVRHLVAADFDEVFLLHVNEGEFPARPRIDPLFRDADRLAFDRWRRQRAAGRPVYRAFRIEEPAPDGERVPVRRTEEVVLFCLALAAARRRAHVSWAAADASGRPLLPSLFVDGLQRLTGADTTPEPLEIIPALDRVATLADLEALTLSRSIIEADGPRQPSWLHALDDLVEPERLDAIVHRARVERARQGFFETLDGDEAVRRRPPEGCPSELAPWLGFIAEGSGAAWVGRSRFPFDADSPASASRIERFGQCPAQFFYADFLRLRPDEEVDEEMDALSRGLLLHRAAESFFDALEARDLGGVEAVRGPRADEARELLANAIEEAVCELADDLYLGHPRLLDVAQRQLTDRTFKALRVATAPRRRSDYLPEGAPWVHEWAFGGPGEPRVSIDLGRDLGEIFVRGRVDRIDRYESRRYESRRYESRRYESRRYESRRYENRRYENRAGEDQIWITDYKTGGLWHYRKLLGDDLLHRRGFQLSLYAVAARQALPMLADEPLAVQYFSLRDGRSERLEPERLDERLGLEAGASTVEGATTGRPRQRSLFEVDAPDDQEAAGSEHPTLVEGLRNVVSGIRLGRFAAATRGCGFCEFGDVCRVTRAVRERED